MTGPAGSSARKGRPFTLAPHLLELTIADARAGLRTTRRLRIPLFALAGLQLVLGLSHVVLHLWAGPVPDLWGSLWPPLAGALLMGGIGVYAPRSSERFVDGLQQWAR